MLVTTPSQLDQVMVQLDTDRPGLVAIDLETQPLIGLEGYPSNQPGRKPTRKDYEDYLLRLLRQYFAIDKLPADPVAFLEQEEVHKYRWQYWKIEQAKTELYKKRKRCKSPSSLCAVDQELAFLETVKPSGEPQLWLVTHIHTLLTNDWWRDDPVKPGLDPYSTDIRLLTISYRRPDGTLSTTVIDCDQSWPAALILWLERHRPVLLGQNIAFDLKHLSYHFPFHPELFRVYDTKVADKILTLGINEPSGLGDLARRYLGVALNKETRNQFIGRRNVELTDEIIRYAVNDVEMLFPIRERQLQIAASLGVTDVLLEFCNLQRYVAIVELAGFPVDRQRWLELAAQAEQIAATKERELLDALGADKTVRATQRREVLELLRQRLGDEFVDQVGEGSLSKQSRDLMAREWIKQTGKSLVLFDLFEQWARAHKRATTYGRDFLRYIHPRTGRIHPSLLVAGTETGRFACRSPNLLNIPTDTDLDYRSAFIAPDGWRWANADYAAMEQRIAADLSNDPALLQIFRSGGDNHSVTAALMFHCKRSDVDQPTPAEQPFAFAGQPIESWLVPANWTAEELVHWIIESGLADRIGKEYKKTTRQAAKAVAFLYFYGGSPVGLSRRTGQQLEASEQFFRDYRAAFPRLAQWFKEERKRPETERYAYNDSVIGCSVTYGNLRRWFRLPNPNQGETVREQVRAEYNAKAELARIGREAQNFPCQGGNAVVLATTINMIVDANATRDNPALRIIPMLGIYDELLCLVADSVDPQWVSSEIRRFMETGAAVWMKVCPPKADFNGVSREWKKY